MRVKNKTIYLFCSSFFLKILRKFSDFVNSDDYIGKKHIKIYQTTIRFYSWKIFEVNKKQIFSSEKMRNFGNCMIMLTRS